MTPRTSSRARPGEIRVSEAAERLGLTPQGVGQYAKRPGAPVRVDGRNVFVQWPAFARWREEQLVAAVQPADLDTARARKANAEAEVAELELAKARGQMVSVPDYERALGAMLDRLVARARALPVRLAHLGDAVEAEAEAEVEAMIAELHGLDDDVLEAPAEDDAA